jgi:Ca2+-binding EF-hand superfamily protein
MQASIGFNFTIPTSYVRQQYQWPAYQYGAGMPFQPPIGIDPRIAQLFIQASQIFRAYDRDWSGQLSHKEFHKAMRHTGYALNDFQCDQLFSMVDQNRSGRIDEREFCEFWAYTHGAVPQPGYGGAMPGVGVQMGAPGVMPMQQPMMVQQPGMMPGQPYGAQPMMGQQPYMAQQPMMPQQPMMSGQPMMAGGAMGAVGGFQFNIPTSYVRPQVQWANYTYAPGAPFQPPMGINPNVSQLFMQGSQIFRAYDRDWSGQLSHKEFAKAMRHTGYAINDFQIDQLFAMVDSNRSGRIDEREFCEFWAYTHGAFAGGVGVGSPMMPGQTYGQPMMGQPAPVGFNVNVGVPGVQMSVGMM